MARDLVARAAEDPRCHCALADALRALGGRAEKTATDLTEKQKKSAVQSRQAMTREERREALLQTPAGREQLRENLEEARASYLKAAALDPEFAAAHRGLGYTLEELGEQAEAGREFVKYLKLAPEALDRQIILNHLKSITETLKGEGSDED
jgi:Flp pilus assembly protein TadD